MAGKVVALRPEPRGEGRPLKLAVGRTVTSNRVDNVAWTWSELTERLSRVDRTSETIETYLAAPREEQDRIKDVGYFVPGWFNKKIRKKGGISERNCVTLDIDHAQADYLDDILFCYGGNAFVLHSTHKHTPDKPRLRLVFPLTRPTEEAEYLAIARKLAQRFGMDYFDDTSYQWSRVMHWPSASSDGQFVCHVEGGKWVDPDEVLREYKDWRDIAQWPKSSRQDDLRLASKKAENPLEKRGIVGAFCRSYTVEEAIAEFLEGVYTPGSTPDRLTYSKGSASNGAVIYDGGLFLFSHHESDPCGGRLVNAFDLVRLHLYGEKDENVDSTTPPSKKPSFKLMSKFANADSRVQQQIAKDRFNLAEDDFSGFDEFGEPVPEEVRAEAPAPAAEPEEPATKPDLRPNANGKWETLRNAEEILLKDVRLKGCVAFNLFTNDLVQLRQIPGMSLPLKGRNTVWSDMADLKVKSYVERKYGLTFSSNSIHEAAMTVGERCAFHPVREYLDKLEWDGKPRLETLFIRYAGSTDTPYHRAITVKTLTAAVARIYDPGAKFDYMLVLEGPQGSRKSTLFRTLARGFFTDSLSFGFEPREVLEATRGAWIAEIPELITRRTDNEHNKHFLSVQSDRARAAYARSVSDVPRQFIIVGSTNESNYLTDPTGNRRWWVLDGDGRQMDIEALDREVDQLWAEAVARYRAGEKLYLDDSRAAAEAVEAQTRRLVEDEWEGPIGAWLDHEIRTDHFDLLRNEAGDFNENVKMMIRDRTCAAEIFIECLGGTLEKMTLQVQRRISDVMRRIPGWSRQTVRLGIRYGRVKGYARHVDL
jgi:predicted P-loop ATPase